MRLGALFICSYCNQRSGWLDSTSLHPHSQDLGGKLDETFTLVGEAVAQLAANTATALKSAQEALDSVLPGPSLQQVLIDLRCAAAICHALSR